MGKPLHVVDTNWLVVRCRVFCSTSKFVCLALLVVSCGMKSQDQPPLLEKGLLNAPAAIRHLPSDTAVVVVLQGPLLKEVSTVSIKETLSPSKQNCLIGDESFRPSIAFGMSYPLSYQGGFLVISTFDTEECDALITDALTDSSMFVSENLGGGLYRAAFSKNVLDNWSRNQGSISAASTRLLERTGAASVRFAIDPIAPWPGNPFGGPAVKEVPVGLAGTLEFRDGLTLSSELEWTNENEAEHGKARLWRELSVLAEISGYGDFILPLKTAHALKRDGNHATLDGTLSPRTWHALVDRIERTEFRSPSAGTASTMLTVLPSVVVMNRKSMLSDRGLSKALADIKSKAGFIGITYLKGQPQARITDVMEILQETGLPVAVTTETESSLAISLSLAKTCKGGMEHACHSLGVMFNEGIGVTKDTGKADEYFEEGCFQGVDESCYELGGFQEGENDAELAYWESRANDESVLVAGKLAFIYKKHAAPAKKEQSNKYFQKAANLGHYGALIEMAIIYHKGRGVRQDDALAIKWLERATSQGGQKAQANLGRLYSISKTHRDYDKSRHWLEVAAKKGSTMAMIDLGEIHYRLDKRNLDLIEGYRWLNKACKQGDTDAVHHIDKLWKTMNKSVKARAVQAHGPMADCPRKGGMSYGVLGDKVK